MLIAAGCSSDSGSDGGSGDGGGDGKSAGSASASASASPSPTVRPAAYGKLPEPCEVLSKKTLGDLVPKAKSGKEGSSSDTATRGNCSWDSLDNNGVKGSQFRWLNVSMLRFESDAGRGAGDARAREHYLKQLQDAEATDGAKSPKTDPVTGTGDEAAVVRYELKKKEGTFKQQTVVARVENVVVTLDYNGAGLAGDKSPSADDLVKDAKRAAKEAVASVSAANGEGAASSTSPSPSESATESPSKSASKSPSKSAAKSAAKSTSERASASARS
ncbi:hypothetical protein GCM10023220_05740 [Streptomyces ziwulingensis]|uniref:DUF3558 domain-containing protein n=2 Tax=Streptomyces ziwulingensis TaxID=1045501 RepID=A0ABP9ASL0_9ACTN